MLTKSSHKSGHSSDIKANTSIMQFNLRQIFLSRQIRKQIKQKDKFLIFKVYNGCTGSAVVLCWLFFFSETSLL